MHHTSRFNPDRGDAGGGSGGAKRPFERVDSDDYQGAPLGDKRQKLPSLSSVVVEAVKLDSLQKLCSSLEPILRKIVGEEVERAIAKLVPNRIGARVCHHLRNKTHRLQFSLYCGSTYPTMRESRPHTHLYYTRGCWRREKPSTSRISVVGRALMHLEERARPRSLEGRFSPPYRPVGAPLHVLGLSSEGMNEGTPGV